MAIEISNEAPVQSWGGSWWSVAWAGQHVGSCVSWGVQPADCRWHCSDHMHRFVETRVEKHGWLLFTGTEKNFEIISASLTHYNVQPEVCAPGPSPFHTWPWAPARWWAPSLSQSSPAHTPLSTERRRHEDKGWKGRAKCLWCQI